MSDSEIEITEEDVRTILSSQQSHYQHIQSMAATFLSIILTSIIAVGGLTTAGLIEPKIPSFPEQIGQLTVTLDMLVEIQIYQLSEPIAAKMLFFVFLMSSFYIITGGMVVFFAILRLGSCLEVGTLDPEDQIRTDDLIIVESGSMPLEVREQWLRDNAKNIQNLRSKFESARFGLLLGALFSMLGGLGIMGSTEIHVGAIAASVFLIPLSLTAFAFEFITKFLHDLWRFQQSDLVHVDSALYTDVTSKLDPLIATLLARKRNMELDIGYLSGSDFPFILISSLVFLLAFYINLVALSIIFKNISF